MKNTDYITLTLTRIQLCDLMLACTAAKSRANDGGKKWTDLHNVIKTIIDKSDAAAIEATQEPAEAPQTAATAEQDEQPTATIEAAQDATQAATAATENNTTPAQGTQEKRHQSRTERLEKLRRPYYTRLYPLWYKLMRPRLMPMQGPNTISWNLNHRME